MVTPNQTWQNGAVWFNEPINITQSFEINLEFNLGSNDGGADGIVLVFQTVGTSALGMAGGGMGFEGFAPSLGIEFDSFQNFDMGDPVFDHLAVFRDGVVNHNLPQNLAGPIAMGPGAVNFEDGQFHGLRVTWDADTELLKVFVDCQLRLAMPLNLSTAIFSNATSVFWGFTGATGGMFNQQSVCISPNAVVGDVELDVCAGESVQLDVSVEGVSNYTWSPTSYLNNANIPTPICTPATSVEYIVTYEDACGEITEANVVVNVQSPSVSVPPLVEMCEGEIANITATGNADSYVWSDGQIGAVANYSSTTTYEVIATLGDCETSASGELVVFENPDVPTLDEPAFCLGQSATLDATTAGNNTYVWSTGEETSSITVDAAGNYNVTVTSSQGCFSEASTTVTILPSPELNLPTLVEMCEGDSELLDAGSGDIYSWTTGEQTQQIEVTETGSYGVVVILNGCEVEASTDVVVYPNPVFTVPTTFSFCSDTTEYFVLPLEPVVWTWDGQAVQDSVLLDDGEHLLSATLGVCSTSETVEVDVLPEPTIALPAIAVICDGQAAEIRATSVYDITWSDGSTGEWLITDIAGVYTATATGVCGSAFAEVEVFSGACDCPVFVPNVFSPNLDGINETFKPSFDCAPEYYRFVIYNRWGEVFFETNDLTQGWNGAGEQRTHYVPDGVYIWQLSMEVMLFDGPMIVEETGTVLIMR